MQNPSSYSAATRSLSGDRELVTWIVAGVMIPVEADAMIVCRRLRLDQPSACEMESRVARIRMPCAADGESGGSKMADEFTLRRVVEKCFSHRDTNAGEDRCA